MNLQDVFVIENLTVLNEGVTGPLKIRGIFQRADEANHNNRIYPKKVLENQVNHLINAISERRLVGELDHPTYEMVKLSNASHLITGLKIQGNEVIGEAEILPTPAGKVVEGLIRGGVKIGISSRGMGTLSEGRNGTKTVNEDFKLVTFDIVADPSTRGAFPTLSESREIKKEKKLIESTIKSVVGERYFLKLLENKINQKLREGGGRDVDYTSDEEDDDGPPPPKPKPKPEDEGRQRRNDPAYVAAQRAKRLKGKLKQRGQRGGQKPHAPVKKVNPFGLGDLGNQPSRRKQKRHIKDFERRYGPHDPSPSHQGK